MGTSRECPECGKAYDHLARVCVACGIDLRTGRKYEPEIGVEEIDDDDNPRAPGRLRVVLHLILEALPGVFRPHILVASVLVGVLGVVLLGMGIFMLTAFMLLFSGTMIAASGVIVYAQAVAWIVKGEMMLLHDALAEFDSIQWNIFFTLLLTPPVVLGLVIWLTGPHGQG